MGYRSDVTIAFYARHNPAEQYPLLKLWFDENYPKHDFCEVEYRPEQGAIIVWYQAVKWYDGYPEVEATAAAIEKFVGTFNAHEDEGWAYESVRVGEETTDIEEHQSTYHDYKLGVSRTIHFD